MYAFLFCGLSFIVAMGLAIFLNMIVSIFIVTRRAVRRTTKR